jgi:hypothetical protein
MADSKFIGFNAPPDLADALADAAERQERTVTQLGTRLAARGGG